VTRLGRRLAFAAGLALAAALSLPAHAPAQEGAATTSTVTIERGERVIVVEQLGRSADGARFILNNPRCEEGVTMSVFYGPPPGTVLTRVDDTRLTSSVALVRVPDDDGDETLELFGGRATIEREGCITDVDDDGAEPVLLEQGRTRVTGTRFFLDQGTDVATMDGPVALERLDASGALALEATSRSLTFDVATERSTLVGDVVVTSDERVSTAERLELDEVGGVAILTGSPAVSRRGGDEVRGSTLRYDLDTDDVIVTGGVEATFEIDLD
jgi:lipopolysaccharide export system protein LptA